ncbi:MAG: histidine phosphatase family protein [Clostridiales bacterium]|nr:histidine phosphatase family protein [Clostridiales bacterium]
MMHFLLIRHGKTQGNQERRYIGDREEPLCDEGRQGVHLLRESGDLPPVDSLMSGPALRCRQTAELLLPNMPYAICPMAEIDFGWFKGKTADDLLGDKAYEAWLETGCQGDIPGGDSVSAFKERCCDTFLHIAEISDPGTMALVIHGGNIMSILERFALPRRNFYDYHVPNCGFFLCRWENGALIVEREGL